MADNINISNPVKVVSDSKQRVAHELMLLIAQWDNTQEEKKRDKRYWLALYRQCLKATSGAPLESILKDD